MERRENITGHLAREPQQLGADVQAAPAGRRSIDVETDPVVVAGEGDDGVVIQRAIGDGQHLGALHRVEPRFRIGAPRIADVQNLAGLRLIQAFKRDRQQRLAVDVLALHRRLQQREERVVGGDADPDFGGRSFTQVNRRPRDVLREIEEEDRLDVGLDRSGDRLRAQVRSGAQARGDRDNRGPEARGS